MEYCSVVYNNIVRRVYGQSKLQLEVNLNTNVTIYYTILIPISLLKSYVSRTICVCFADYRIVCAPTQNERFPNIIKINQQSQIYLQCIMIIIILYNNKKFKIQK